MRLKSFYAPSMAEAMKQVKDTLGDDAIIVNTREEKSGIVKITAAVEKIETSIKRDPIEGVTSTPVSNDELAIFSDEDIIESITDSMLRHRVPSSVSEKIIATAMTIPGSNPRKVLSDTLQKIFEFKKPSNDVTAKHTMLVGPPGAGKTLMTAKMAAQSIMNNTKPIVVTTDITRAGGIEQLSAFLKIMEIPLETASSAKELKDIISKADKNTEVIVDTGGLNPFDPDEMKTLAKLIKAGDFAPLLVLPAGTDAEESADIAMTFEVLGVKQLIPTRLDFARHIGGVLSAADRAELSFTEASHTPAVANGILYLNAEIMADLLIPKPSKKGTMKS